MKLVSRLFVASLLFSSLIACEDDETDGLIIHQVDTSYLSAWYGNYEGSSKHSSQRMSFVNGQMQMVSHSSTRDVKVNVIKGALDSTLKLTIVYDDTLFQVSNDLYFSSTGVHQTSSGIGSGAYRLDISFASDSLHYYTFQNCGMACSSSKRFDIQKVN